MGAQRIQEVNMFALLFLLVGVIFLLAAAGRIWLDATPANSPTIDSAATSNVDKPAMFGNISDGSDSHHS